MLRPAWAVEQVPDQPGDRPLPEKTKVRMETEESSNYWITLDILTFPGLECWGDISRGGRGEARV